jgi:hypothetical protein
MKASASFLKALHAAVRQTVALGLRCLRRAAGGWPAPFRRETALGGDIYLRVPSPAPPPAALPPRLREALAVEGARLLSPERFRPLAALTARGVVVTARLRDATPARRPALLIVAPRPER